jgi:hypothetical protein
MIKWCDLEIGDIIYYWNSGSEIIFDLKEPENPLELKVISIDKKMDDKTSFVTFIIRIEGLDDKDKIELPSCQYYSESYATNFVGGTNFNIVASDRIGFSEQFNNIKATFDNFKDYFEKNFTKDKDELIKLLIEEQKHLSSWVNTLGGGHLAFDEKSKLRTEKINELLKKLNLSL